MSKYLNVFRYQNSILQVQYYFLTILKKELAIKNIVAFDRHFYGEHK